MAALVESRHSCFCEIKMNDLVHWETNVNTTQSYGLRLRLKPYPQYTTEPVFMKNATRNFSCISIFSSIYVQPYGWVLFFIIYYIIYIHI